MTSTAAAVTSLAGHLPAGSFSDPATAAALLQHMPSPFGFGAALKVDGTEVWQRRIFDLF